MRKPDRSPEAAAELILLIGRLGLRKKVSCVELLIANELKQRAVKIIRTAFRDHVYDTARGLPEFSGKVVGLYFKLLDSIW